jgi:hypothetical protein
VVGGREKKALTVVQHDTNIQFFKNTKRKESWEKRGKIKEKKTHKIAVCTHTCEREEKPRRNSKLDLFGTFLFPAKK